MRVRPVRFTCIFVCSVALLTASPTLAASSWTETFDDGVGRLDHVVGNGATSYVYDPVDQNIDASFVRGPAADARLALLDHVFDQDDSAAFSIDITPRSIDSGRPRLGFFDSASGLAVVRVELDNFPLPGDVGPVTILPTTGGGFETGFSSPVFWDFDETYRIAVAIDGPQHELTFSTSRLDGGTFVLLRSETLSFPDTLAFSYDSLGLGNIVDTQGIGLSFNAEIDNLSFTAIPVPAALPAGLMLLAALAVRRRRAG